VTAVLIQHATTVGLSGTLAVGAAKLLGMDLFQRFAWNGADAALALAISLPLLALEAAVGLPPYRLPRALLAPAGADATAPSGSAEGSGEQVDLYAVQAAGWGPAAVQLALALYQREVLGLWAQPPGAAKLPLQVCACARARGGGVGGWVGWVCWNDPAPWTVTPAQLGDPAPRPPHSDLGRTPLPPVRPPAPHQVEAALILMRELSKELLQRGLVATVSAGW
jgi:hypothetical protein